MNNPHVVFNIQIGIFLFCFGIAITVMAVFYHIELFTLILPTILALIGLYIVIAVFYEASGIADQWFIYNIADRAIAWETVIDRIGPFQQITSPRFVNQGGDAIAYENLLMMYRKSGKDDELHDRLKQQLNKIFDNVESTDSRDFFKYVSVYLDGGFDPNNDFKWPIIPGGQRIQDKTIFWPRSIIGQLHHTIYWMTRAQCACLLREEQSFKNFSGDKAKRKKLLADFDPSEMFQAVVSVINEDYSLVVRKEALKTYIYWVCSDEACKSHFINDRIYYFDEVPKHWKDNKAEILKNFDLSLDLKDN